MPEFLLKVQGTIHTLSTPWVMGILNITPDSFFTGSRFSAPDDAAREARAMLKEGAKIIDIGAYSSRPGADVVSEEEEWDRLKEVIPAVAQVMTEFPNTFISVDTFRSVIADKAINAGAHMINDISGGNLDPQIYATAAQHKCPYIMMHMQGNPANMQKNPSYQNVTTDIVKFFSEKLPLIHELGVHDTIIDVGFGFGKTLEDNFQLLRELKAFQLLGRPILTGISRKSMVYKPLESSAAQSINGTTALHMAALQGGAQILRVHDVKEATETVTLFTHLMPQGIDHLLPIWER